MFGSSKVNKIRENEKKLRRLHGTILLTCSHSDCQNRVKVTHKEANRLMQCSKCGIGFLKR